jgi:hypothetical protein
MPEEQECLRKMSMRRPVLYALVGLLLLAAWACGIVVPLAADEDDATARQLDPAAGGAITWINRCQLM